mmetsp:Transcript_13448/g.54303  ORF Transcript_13448/g.54303 Transcript_13448/m.54303 type:complete len:357 (+) Transcript_13448:271-1341(+)
MQIDRGVRLFNRCVSPRTHLITAASFGAICLILYFCAPASVIEGPKHIKSKTTAENTRCCVVVKNSRYLLNAGGFQIGHWGFLLADVFAKLNRIEHRQPKSCEIIFTDNVASRHRLRQVEKAVKGSMYMHTSLALIGNMSGTSFRVLERNRECGAPLHINADALKVPTHWLNLTAYRVPEDAARDVLKCNVTATEDVLIYNRQGTRTIANYEDVMEYLESSGLRAKVLFSDQLSPEEQICEMVKERSVLITPHGGQQGSLFFKRAGVAVVVVSPESHLLEYYRFFSRETDPWYHIRGNRSWSCVRRFCASSPGAWGNDGSCGLKCERKARGESINLSLSALHNVLGEMGLVHLRSA